MLGGRLNLRFKLLVVPTDTSCCAHPGAFIFFERSKKTNQKKTAPAYLSATPIPCAGHEQSGDRQNGRPWPYCRRFAHPALAPAGLNRIVRTLLRLRKRGKMELPESLGFISSE